MCQTWLRDEQNHYIGLRQIYHKIYGDNIKEIDAIIKSRKPDFTPISHLLKDEFSILIAIAFDEITSARAYAQDRETYEAIGGKAMLDWVKLAGRDEGVHAGNALSLIRYNHRSRLSEIPEHVRLICDYETKDNVTYHGTFLFDHDTDDFSRELLEKSGDTLCSHFNRRTDFSDLISRLEI